MELESVTLKLPRELLSGAQRVATARDVTIGHMVRQLLKREVARQMSAKSPGTPDEPLLRALQALLARDMSEARDWDDLAQRLRLHGYDMRSADDDVSLFKTSCNTYVCKGSELGFSFASMVKRFKTETSERNCARTHLGVMPSGDIDRTRHAMLSGHIDGARNWPDLINRFACEGIELRLNGTSLGIYTSSTGRHLCNSDTLGAGYRVLVQRFGRKHPSDGRDLQGSVSPANAGNNALVPEGE